MLSPLRSGSGSRPRSRLSEVILIIFLASVVLVLLHEPLVQVVDSDPAPTSTSLLLLRKYVPSLGDVGFSTTSNCIVTSTSSSVPPTASEASASPTTPTPVLASVVVVVEVPVPVPVPLVAVVPVSPVPLLANTAPVLLVATAQVREGDVRHVGQGCDHLVDVVGPEVVGDGGGDETGGVETGVVQLDLQPSLLGSGAHLVLRERLRVHAGSTAAMTV